MINKDSIEAGACKHDGRQAYMKLLACQKGGLFEPPPLPTPLKISIQHSVSIMAAVLHIPLPSTNIVDAC